jgi:hypothetical protein
MEMEELERKLVVFTSNDKSFIVTSEHLLRLASQAKDIFESSQPAKKNKILRTLLANCTLSGKKFNFILLKLFDKLCTEVKNTNWLAVVDALRTSALDFENYQFESLLGAIGVDVSELSMSNALDV